MGIFYKGNENKKSKYEVMANWMVSVLLHSQKQTKNVADFKIYLAYIEHFYEKASLR